MHVISKRSLLFVNFAETKAGAAKARQKFTLAASPSLQEVPDWVLGLESYKRALKAKVLKQVQYVPEEPDEEESEAVKEEPKPVEEPKGKARSAK